jgi:SNF family Na+-dependent transporter
MILNITMHPELLSNRQQAVRDWCSAFTDAINQMPGATFWSIMFFLMLLTLGLDSLFGALESVTTALQDVRGFGKLRREILSGEHRMRPDSFFYRNHVNT